MTKNGSFCNFGYKLPLFTTYWDRLTYLICVEIDPDDKIYQSQKKYFVILAIVWPFYMIFGYFPKIVLDLAGLP